MARHLQLLGALALVGHPCAGPAAKENYGVHPMFGPLKPSKDIKDFVASVFRKKSGEEEETTLGDLGTTLDSGESLRPRDGSLHADMGFELYWPGGQWVLRKAELDRCNTSEAECSPVYKDYGRVCAGSSDLQAHHTFDNMCELADANCRDGTASIMTTSMEGSTIRWWPVKRNSYVRLKINAQKPLFLVLTRAKDLTKVTPQYFFYYGDGSNNQIAQYVHYNNYNNGNYRNYDWITFVVLRFKQRWSRPFLDDTVRTWEVYWNESLGQVTWVLKDLNQYWERDASWTYPEDSQEHYKKIYRDMPVRYIGIYGGSEDSPNWIEMTGLPRGYLVAYRGECREDLPTLATDAPARIGERHKIQLFNFAERMDEFGYNYTRVPLPTISDYGLEDYGDYPMFP